MATSVRSYAAAAGPRSLTAGRIVGTIFACLVVGHLVINAYFPSFAINAVGLVLVTLILGRVLFVKRDVFAFILIVFFCSHFQYASHQGGLFNLVAFILGGAYLVFAPNIRETRSRDPVISTLVIILLISNTLGLVLRNPMPMYVIVLEGASFTAFLIAFVIAGHLELTGQRLRKFLIVSAVMIAYNFVVSLNQHYSVLNIQSPLLSLTSDLFYRTSNAYGVFGSASSNGQWAMMMIALLAPLVAATASIKALRISPFYFVPILVICGLTIVLSNMRAAAVEAVLIVIIYLVMFSVFYRRSFRNSKYMNLAATATIILFGTVGVWVGLQNIEHDFEGVTIQNAADVKSGGILNRAEPWQWGMHVLKTGSWWVGYGHGNLKSNLIAWGGKWTGTGKMGPALMPGEIIGGGHFHNLYLALPTLYGWVGAVAYVLVFLVVVFRLTGAVRRYSLDNMMVVTCLGFLMSLVFFLLDEIKSGNAVQHINFPMIVWIWLGLALAALRTLRSELALARRQRMPQPEAEKVAEEELTPDEEHET
jgi:hypothetical protein